MFPKVIPILGILLLLSSCYSNPKDLEKITKLEARVNVLELNSEKYNEFESKKSCAEIDINDDIVNNWGKYAEDYSIDEVFYSKNENTCIGIITLRYGEGIKEVWGYNILEKNWFLNKTSINPERFDEAIETLKN